jgi:hypothetical protein
VVRQPVAERGSAPPVTELQPAQGIGDVDWPDRRRVGPRLIHPDVERLAPEGRGEARSRPDWSEMQPDKIDLATERRLEPSLRRAGLTGSAENVERATSQLAGG